MVEKTLLRVSSSPHIRNPEDTHSVMLDVVIALFPALGFAMWFFGAKALMLTCVSVLASMFFEWGYRRLMKKPDTTDDMSAVVTGMLIAFCMPPAVPAWLPVIGAFFAIVVVKQLYGGIGKNFLNPALAARAFLFSWPVLMTTWSEPLGYNSFFNLTEDAVTCATPLAALSAGGLPEISLNAMFIGKIGGSLGETSALALIVGGIYLMLRRVISPRIPLSYLLSVAAVTLLFPKNGVDNLSWMLYNLLSGSLLLGAVFMATDYTTSPVTKKGQIIFGIGCGLLTVFFRYFGAYAEGVSYAILIMNVCVWFIDKASRPRRFGVTGESLKRTKKEAGV